MGDDRGARMGIMFMLAGMLFISLNDVLIKALSDGYALHQLVFVRNGIGIMVSVVILQMEGGVALLRTRRPGLHLLRALLIVCANLSFYAAIVMMPLATATALYFIAPLIVTLLAGPVLGEWVGPRRALAVIAGFAGVLVMLWPQISGQDTGIGWAAVLPLLAAAGYAGMSVLTRKLGGESRASAMAIYLQSAFLVTGVLAYVFAGDGRWLSPEQPLAVQFLLRPWIWPPAADVPVLLLLGMLSGGIGYCMSQAYRLAAAATVAPFEYTLLLFAAGWGWMFFGELPGPFVVAGAILVIAAGAYVALRADRVRAP
ncbi:MAG: DMT family transporter [Rhodobacteraceae bacterium]|nr:DMT family transporter [Paracoccaceae bacterium]